jgi:PAS domain S-box-containing protein
MPTDPTRAAARAKVADALLDSAAEAIIATDRAGIITFWNAGAVRIFGFPAAEALGQSLDLIIPERLQARHWDGFHKMVDSGVSRYAEGHVLSVPGRRQDGAQISVAFTIAAIKENGAISGLVAVMRDVTASFEEMKRLRKQANA